MEYITIETPINAHDVTLIPVVRICLHSNYNTTGCWLSGNKQPLAIIVCDSNGVHAINISSFEISIESLLQKIPGLYAELEKFCQ